MRRVALQDYQELTGADASNIGIFAQGHVDAAVRDGIGAGNYYVDCDVVQNGAAAITVAPGRVYLGGKIYYRDVATGYTLTANLPVTTQKIATVLIWGTEIDTDLQPRDFIVSEATGEAEARTVPLERRRALQMDVIFGAESPNPVRGAVGTGLVAVADILLTPTGIERITMLAETELQSAEALRVRADVSEAFQEGAGKRIETLATDIANLAEGQKGIPSASTLRSLLMDVARLKRLEKIPTVQVGYGFDYFQDDDGSDPAHPSWLALRQEGVRFPPAAIVIAQIRPLNPSEPKITKTGDFILPAYTEEKRISVVGNDAQISAADNQYQVTTMVQRSVSRSATSYGTSYTTCTNRPEFYTGTYNATSQVLTKNGETFAVAFTGKDWGAETGTAGDHREVRLTQFWTDTWTETYWDAVVTTEGLNGSQCAQTFLNNAAGWLTGINLFLSKAASAGSVKLVLCETTASASPDLTKVIAVSEVPAANLKTYPAATRFAFPPRYLDPGKRYGLVAVTSGQHFFCQVSNNKYAQGSFFQGSDGGWFQGSLTLDLAFEAIYAKFATTRVEVDLQPLSCQNGISNLKTLIAGKVPDGTRLTLEVKPATGNAWFPIAPDTGMTPFNGLPPLMQFRAVFIGTTDLMPGIDLAQSETWAWRPRTDFTWISKLFTLPAGVTTTSVKVEFRLENFDPAHHTFTPTMIVGASNINPSSIVKTVDGYDPKAFVWTCTFPIAATNSFRFKSVGVTDAAANTFIISTDFWFAA
ncbi:hypothetical protein [Methylobacterium nigriterrae]|uniref:hypothetical protein n=1 Tax=Methylobacterium nigriterrae TaxID=3127512 RepID=UPI003013C50C